MATRTIKSEVIYSIGGDFTNLIIGHNENGYYYSLKYPENDGVNMSFSNMSIEGLRNYFKLQKYNYESYHYDLAVKAFEAWHENNY